MVLKITLILIVIILVRQQHQQSMNSKKAMKLSMFDASFYHQDSYEFDVNGIQDLKKGYVNVHITYLF